VHDDNFGDTLDDEFGQDRIEGGASPHRASRRGRSAALLTAGVVAGAALAGGATAFATSGSSGNAGTSTATSSGAPNGQPRMGSGPVGGSTPVRSDEKALDAAAAAKVKAAALKAVPGGTVYRVETDAGDATYEAHMTKADGTLVTVKLDKNFTVTAVEAGMGKGDPTPAGGAGGPHGQGPGTPGSQGGYAAPRAQGGYGAPGGQNGSSGPGA